MKIRDLCWYVALSPLAVAIAVTLALFDVFAPRAERRDPSPPAPYDDDPFRRIVSGP